MRRTLLYVILLTTAALPGLALAQDDAAKTVPQSRNEITFSFAPVVKKAAPAVVNIYTKSRQQVQQPVSPFMNDPFFRQFFGNGFAFGNRPREQVISSLGSGVIIKPDGMIVTSLHVVKDAQEIKVALADKREFPAKVVVRDPQFDLAFLKIDAPAPLPYLEMRDSDSLEVGDLVLAIGNPFGVGQTVTNGIVSALARAAVGVSDYQFFIQTDAAINPGNSGGALVDMQGKLVGINTAIYTQSGGSTGIGFAIPANMVRSLLSGKVEDGVVVRPWLGFSVQPVTPQIAESLGMAKPEGILVVKLAPHSPAEQGGLKAGDVITAVDGSAVGSEADMQYKLALLKIGDTAKLTIFRNGKPQDIAMTLAAPPEVPRNQMTFKGQTPLNGVTVANLSIALAQQLRLPDIEDSGVVVVDSENTIFTPGDIILEVNGVKVTSTDQLEKLLKTRAFDWRIVYQRGGNVLNLTVRMSS